jgi:conjugal transfer pilus assembly protein TraU
MKKAFLALVLLACSLPAFAGSQRQLMCPDNTGFLGQLITGICWGAIFPVRLGGVSVYAGQNGRYPSGAASRPLCLCGNPLNGEPLTIGFTLGFWKPAKIMEVVRHPYCMPMLGGIQLSSSAATAGGERTIGGGMAGENVTDNRNSGFYNWNYYTFPLLMMLDILDAPGCSPGEAVDLDLLGSSAFYPNWYDNDLSFFVNPEIALYSNPIALSAQPIDCAVASAGEPIDAFHWVSGCWGAVFPLNGHISVNSSPVGYSSLLAHRGMAMMSRLGMHRRTMGNDAICEKQIEPIFQKSQYKMQMLFPIPEAKGQSPQPFRPGDSSNGGTQVPEIDPAATISSGCTHPIGKSTMLWGEWRTRPATGEDYSYLVWQWTDCCFGKVFDGM